MAAGAGVGLEVGSGASTAVRRWMGLCRGWLRLIVHKKGGQQVFVNNFSSASLTTKYLLTEKRTETVMPPRMRIKCKPGVGNTNTPTCQSNGTGGALRDVRQQGVQKRLEDHQPERSDTAETPKKAMIKDFIF